MNVRKTVPDGQAIVLFSLPGFVELAGHCNNGVLNVVSVALRDLNPSAAIDFGTTHGGFFNSESNTNANVFVAQGTSNFADTIQVGQAYRLLEGGPVRTRVVTFFTAGRFGVSGGPQSSGQPCLFQAQALAQGY